MGVKMAYVKVVRRRERTQIEGLCTNPPTVRGPRMSGLAFLAEKTSQRLRERARVEVAKEVKRVMELVRSAERSKLETYHARLRRRMLRKIAREEEREQVTQVLVSQPSPPPVLFRYQEIVDLEQSPFERLIQRRKIRGDEIVARGLKTLTGVAKIYCAICRFPLYEVEEDEPWDMTWQTRNDDVAIMQTIGVECRKPPYAHMSPLTSRALGGGTFLKAVCSSYLTWERHMIFVMK